MDIMNGYVVNISIRDLKLNKTENGLPVKNMPGVELV
jgi:polygalacturonase